MGLWILQMRCWLFGHDWVQRIYYDEGRSVYSATCTKCGRMDADDPPADWIPVIRRLEQLDIYRSTAAILASPYS
jgi:hypothetical protein